MSQQNTENKQTVEQDKNTNAKNGNQFGHDQDTAAEPTNETKNVKCSFCGDDTFCETCKKSPELVSSMEHMCYLCYQKMGGQLPENVRDKTHLCLPPEVAQENFEKFLSEMTYRAFSDLWNAEKKKLKELSRQDLAQTGFFEGARFMFGLMQRLSQHEHDSAHDHTHIHTHGHEGKTESKNQK